MTSAAPWSTTGGWLKGPELAEEDAYLRAPIVMRLAWGLVLAAASGGAAVWVFKIRRQNVESSLNRVSMTKS